MTFPTFLGGNNDEPSLFSVKLDFSGTAYIAGASASSGYPSTPAASQSTNKGEWDAAVTEIEPVQVATETGETRLLFACVAAPRRAGSR